MTLIVVGVDGSPSADTAARWTAQLARAVGARVLAVHVVPTSWEWELAAFQVDTRPLIRQRRDDLAGHWTEPLRAAGVTYTTRFVRGNPGKELLRIAEEQDADLIVIGAKPHRAVHNLVVGGTTHQIVNQDRRPVVLVPSRAAVQFDSPKVTREGPELAGSGRGVLGSRVSSRSRRRIFSRRRSGLVELPSVLAGE